MFLGLSTEVWLAIVGVLFSISEILGAFDYFKNSSVFQLIVSILKKLLGKS